MLLPVYRPVMISFSNKMKLIINHFKIYALKFKNIFKAAISIKKVSTFQLNISDNFK
jgi:hypothetical protein